MLKYSAFRAIDHHNIIKIIGAQRKNCDHGSRLFLEFSGRGYLKENMKEPPELFVIHLFQTSSTMKYLHQRAIIHFDLKLIKSSEKQIQSMKDQLLILL